MHVKMKHSLSCDLSIVLHNIKSITVQCISQFSCHFF